jgi:hypothetical protein
LDAAACRSAKLMRGTEDSLRSTRLCPDRVLPCGAKVTRANRRAMARAAWLILLLGLAGLVVLPQGFLACADAPFLRSASRDGAHELTVCRRPVVAPAMPGQGSDGPGWAVLRDSRRGLIEGVVAIDALISIGHPPAWEPRRVTLPLVAEFDLAPPASTPLAWLRDRLWRLRAWAGLVPSDSRFR